MGEQDILGDTDIRQKGLFLEHHSDACVGCSSDAVQRHWLATQCDPSAVRRKETGENLEESRFARSVLSDKTNYLMCSDLN